MGLDSRGLSFLAAAFVLLLGAAVLLNLVRRRGRVHAGRVALAGLWVAYTAALVPLGFPQYGLASVPPAAISTGLALLVVYSIAGRAPAAGLSGVVRVLVAAVLATAALPLALLYSLTVLRIDNL